MNLGYRPFLVGRSGMARPLRRLLKARDGVETVEFALVSIALFTFLLGVVEFGRLYWTQSELQSAAEAGARYCTIHSDPTDVNACSTSTAGVKDYIVSQVLGMSIASGALSNFQAGAQDCGNQVSFTYTFHFIVSGLLPQTGIDLNTVACHQA
jgi:Flp pilus assembly protein TadG